MYYNNRFGGNRFGASRGRSFGGGRRPIRMFDPTNVILNSANKIAAAPVQEFAVTHEFSDFKVAEPLKRNIVSRGYKTPTPVQDQAIPAILEGRDLIGIANTGTGKTAAFLIPLINKVILNRNEQVLIMAPTRELAAQIRDEFMAFSYGLNIYCALCIGGANMGRQIDSLRRNPNFVVGTPGRIKDLLETRHLNISKFGTFVLDEADHMVDIGFINDIKYMISLLPQVRQSLFFSATIDGKVRDILNCFVLDPVVVSVKTGDTAQNVKQEIVKVLDRERKIEQLHSLLIREEFEKVLVFGRTKYGVQKLSDALVRMGLKANAIHGNKNQNQRMRVIDDFKRNYIKILIATDVASRGLDIPNVSHVVNYDLPESYDAYIHRIGRTGRADKKGIALTFIE